MHPPTRPSVFSPRPSCAAALLGLSILLLGGTCSLALDRGPLEIEVLPPDLMADTRVRLRLVGLADELPGNLAWSVEAGRLFSDDAPLVEWRTPREPGRYHLVVRRPGGAAGQAGGEILAERTVEVKRPSTEGRVWIPGGEFVTVQPQLG